MPESPSILATICRTDTQRLLIAILDSLEQFHVPRLESANIVFAGHFNPYLISPEWLAKEHIWNPTEVQLVLGGVRQDSVRFQGGGVEWMLSSDRLIIGSIIHDCGELGQKVLKELPHTPISGTGANFVFQDPELTIDHPVFRTAKEVFPNCYVDPELFKWGIVLQEADVRTELSCVAGDQGASFAVNRHRKTETTNAAIVAVVAFENDKTYATELVDRLLSGAKQ